MSLFWVSLKLCAEAALGAARAASAISAGASRRKGRIILSLCEAQGLAETGSPKPCGLFLYLTNTVRVQLFLEPGIGLAGTMSSALTHPGVPIAKRVLAREARSRAVLLSPRR